MFIPHQTTPKLFQRKLGKTKEERLLLFRHLMKLLVLNDRITTTKSIALETRKLANKLVNDAKHGNKDEVSKWLNHKTEIIDKFYKDIVPRYQNMETEQYTRIWKLNPRESDAASQSVLEFINGKYDMKKFFDDLIAKSKK